MSVFFNSMDEIPKSYKEFAYANQIIEHNHKTYCLLGEYSIPTQGMERALLIIKALAAVIFTAFLALFSARIRANLCGHRIDKVCVDSPRAVIARQSYQPEEDLYAFRKKIFHETQNACLFGYIVGGKQVKIDHEPKGTETYDQVEPLAAPQKIYKTQFSVIPQDTFDVLLQRKKEGYNPAGINMANRYHAGGGVDDGCPAQEEALCRRSNHIFGLKTQKYPMPEMGGIYCPHVQVFRNSDFTFLDEPQDIALVALAAYDLRKESPDRSNLELPLYSVLTEEQLRNCPKFIEGTKNRIRNALRKMAMKGHTSIVLGALGCGAFQNPPKLVAECFQEVFQDKEFKGHFKLVDFAILKLFKNDQNNIDAFTQTCQILKEV